MASFIYNTMLTMGTENSSSIHQGQTMPGVDANGIFNKVIDKTDSGIVLLVIIIVVALIVLFPMIIKLIKETRRSNVENDQKFIDVITKNNEAFSSLKEALNVNNTTLDKSLRNIEELSASTNSNMTTSVTHQIQLDKSVNRLLQNVIELSAELNETKIDIGHVRDVQVQFADNQEKIIEMISGNTVNIDEMKNIMGEQSELLNSVSMDIEKIGKKVTTATKKASTTKKKKTDE